MARFPRWNHGNISRAMFLKRLRACLNGTDVRTPIQRVYVVDQTFELLTVQSRLLPILEARRVDMVKVMRLALSMLRQQPQRYPQLSKIIKSTGFVFAVDFGDATYCRSDVPIFTLAAPVGCNSSLPIPTYDTIRQTTLRTFRTRLYNLIYPWWVKKRAVVWRGSPTGPGDATANRRAQLVRAAALLRRPDLTDVALTSLPPEWPANVSSGLVGRHIPMYLFQLYRAVLDIDGESWSARFGSLLCMSSVVLKVEPSYVDYFYPGLRPWVHYIPVRGDLSDLEARAVYATSDSNARDVQQIIRNANGWCLQKLRLEVLANDLLRIWNGYVGFFDDPDVASSLLDEFPFVPETGHRHRIRAV
jgi:hypothetical protein